MLMDMKSKLDEQAHAIVLRRKGLTYREILKVLPVAKSSLSLWLGKLPLSGEEKKFLKRNKDGNMSRGRIAAAVANHRHRLERDEVLFIRARAEFENLKSNPLFFVGVALYWAEGSKRTSNFQFVNSDDEMMQVMILWIEQFLKIPRRELKVRLFIHRPYAHEQCEKQWSERLRIPISNFQKTIYKPTGRLVKKRPDYRGCLRIEIGPVIFLRLMRFWQRMLFANIVKKSKLHSMLS